MQLKFLAGIFALALATTTFAAPVPEPISALITIEARSVSPSFTFSGDLKDIVIPPAGTDKKSKAKNTKAKAQQAVKVTKQNAAKARVQAVLNAAAPTLGLSGALAVDVSNDFHDSISDLNKHATFSFSAAECKGKCVGHAYNPTATHSPGKGQVGKIFDAKHDTIFGHNATEESYPFGAGNIGRGFIGPLLVQSGYHVVFADVDSTVIDELNNRDHYDVRILDSTTTPSSGPAKPKEQRESISSVSGIITTKMDDVVKEFEDPKTQIVTTAVGPPILEKIAPTIAKCLQARRRAQAGVLNVIACENMVNQTSHLRDLVASHLEDEDEAWVAENIGWANCSVDRIVPPAGDEQDDNPLNVGVEDFYEWVVDANGLKDDGVVHFPLNGMKLTEDLSGYIERKLFTLNCGHAITAYLGYLKGYDTVDQSIKDPKIREIVKGALEESGRALIKKHSFDEKEHVEYIQKTLTRFENPNLKDDVGRVGRQPLRKLGKDDRLLGPVNMAKAYSLPVPNLLKGIAAAFLYDAEDDEQSTQVQAKIREKDIGNTLKEVTGFEEGTEEYNTVLSAYQELGEWKARQ